MQNTTRKTKRISVVLMAIIFCLMASLAFANLTFAADTTNKLLNGNFEDLDKNSFTYWSFESWQDEGSMFVDTQVRHSGKASVRIENSASEPSDSRIHQILTLQPGTIYRVSCWVKTKNVEDKNYGANISFANVDLSNGYVISKDVRGTKDWKKLTLFFKTAQDMTSVELTIGLGNYSTENSGTIWIDDVTLDKATEVADGYTLNEISSPSNVQDSGTENGGGISPTMVIIIIASLLVLFIAGIFFVPSKNKKFDIDNANGTGKKGNSSTNGRQQQARSNKNTKSSAMSSRQAREVELQELLTPKEYHRLKLHWKDWAIMGAVTVIYAIIAFVNLGSLYVPQTGWTGTQVTQQYTFEVPQPVTLSKVGVYYGYGEQKIKLMYQDETGKYVNLTTIDKKADKLWKWEFFATNTVTAKRFRVVTESATKPVAGDPGGTFNELTFLDASNNNISLADCTIIADESDADGQDSFMKLIDEQDRVTNYCSYYTGTYFDEIYHPRTAFENLYDITVYEVTHPPLGKYLMSFGIRMFGMTPFGWRFMGTLFGVLMLPFLYLFAMKLFKKKRFWAFCAMFLMSVEFMHFSLTRIATIDSYVTFFIILMYYLMYDYYVHTSVNIGFKKSITPLLLCGIAFGLGIASKWIGVYAGGGLAVLFFMTKFDEIKRYNVAKRTKEGAKTDWVRCFIQNNIVRTVILCILFFVIVPFLIYTLSYIPTYFDANSNGIVDSMTVLKDNIVSGKWFSIMFDNQTYMYNYHSKLEATHNFSSSWYQWPLTAKPLFAFRGADLPGGATMSSTIDIMGNPAVFWMGLLAFPFAIFYAIKNKERGMVVVLVAILFQFVPWMLVERCIFIYHYFSTTPFMILALVYVLKNALEPFGRSGIIIMSIYLLICMLLFIGFYPILSGLEVPKAYVSRFLQWFGAKSNTDFFYWVIT